MKYRVDELAARSGLSVDTVRFYQTRGLLPPPMREGRIVWYGKDHLDRLRRIRDLQRKGFSLASIQKLLNGELDQADEALVAEVSGTPPGEGDENEEFLTLQELADRIGVSPALVQAIEREHLLVPRFLNGEPVYTSADLRAAAAGLSLIEAGLPIGDLLALAREHDASARQTAERAVEMFNRHIRAPIHDKWGSTDEAAQMLVDAFRVMLPATVALVAHHFRRVLLATAQERIEREGDVQELTAVRSESQRKLD